MGVKQILLLGNEKLYERSEIVKESELEFIQSTVQDLHDTMMNFRKQYGKGRAIAAPQIGVMKRLLYFSVDNSMVMINPEVTFKSREIFEIWDDCMCFPDLLVKVNRNLSCKVKFRDLNWAEKEIFLEKDMSELFQHEFDHLEGVLAVSKAVDVHSFSLVSERTAH